MNNSEINISPDDLHALEASGLLQPVEGTRRNFRHTDSLFGYDRVLEQGGNIVALESSMGKPRLFIGMPVTLGILDSEEPEHFGLSEFYIGEHVTIVGFKEPYESYNSNYIVTVAGEHSRGSVKLTRIFTEEFNLADWRRRRSGNGQIVPPAPRRLQVPVETHGAGLTDDNTHDILGGHGS